MNKSILVAALLAVALTACGKKEEPKAAAPAPAPAAAAPAPAPAAAPQAGMEAAKPAEQAGMAGAAAPQAGMAAPQAGMEAAKPAEHAGMEAKKELFGFRQKRGCGSAFLLTLKPVGASRSPLPDRPR